SYCASVLSSQQSQFGPPGMTRADPYVTVYQSDALTWVAYNDNIVTEPSAYLQSRACFIWPNVGTYGFIRVTQNSNFANTYDVGLIETTMFCPWFFIGGDYNAFSLIRNTTDSTVNAQIVWRDSTGAIAGWTNLAIAGNGNVALNARTYVNPAATSSGSVELA